MSTKTTNFAAQVLGVINKDEETVQKETIVDIVSDYKIQCETQIGFLKTGSVPQLKLKLDQEKRELAKAEKSLEASYLDLKNGNFKKYISSITEAEDNVIVAKETISELEAEIAEKDEQVAKFEALLAKLKS